MSTAAKVQVMIVEDDPSLNSAYKRVLKAEGYSVRTALNGKEALDIVGQLPAAPELILLDLRMPVLDGIGFLHEFQARQHPECSVVIFTNVDVHKDVDEAFSLGAKHYILKARTTVRDIVHLAKRLTSPPMRTVLVK